MKLTNIAIRNIKRNKKRSLLSMISTTLATMFIVFMFSFINGVIDDIKNIAINYNTGEILIRNVEYDDKSFSLDRAIDNYKEVITLISRTLPEAELSPRINFPSTVMDRKNYDKSYVCFGIGVDFETEYNFLKLEDKIIEGDMPVSSREVIMGHGLAKELGLSIGDKFTPITSTRKGSSSGITFKVTAFGKFDDPAFSNKSFIVSLEELPKMLRMDGAVSDILIKGIGDKKLDATIEKLNSVFGDSEFNYVEARTWKSGAGYDWMQMARAAYNVIGLIFFLLASTVIANTMLMAVFERRKEIGTITAMGMTDAEVVRLFFLEAFYIGAVGAGAGVVIGTIAVLPLSYFGLDMSAMAGSVDMGASWNIFPRLSFNSTLFVYIYSVFIASFVSFFPSKSAAKVDPIVALRSE